MKKITPADIYFQMILLKQMTLIPADWLTNKLPIVEWIFYK